MSVRWQLKIYDAQQLVHSTDVDGAVEVGRQTDKEPAPYFARRIAGVWRVVIARLDETDISRKHLRVEPLPGGNIKLRNLSATLSVHLSAGGELPAGAERELTLPVIAAFGTRSIRFESPEVENPALQSLVEATRAPGRSERILARAANLRPAGESVSLEQLLPWLRTALSILESAAGAADFFDKAARAVVEMVGMDTGRVLLRKAGDWKVQAEASAAREETDWRPSRQVLNHLLEEKRTFWLTPGHAAESLLEVKAVVAAPILDRHSEVIGALYGDRRQDDPRAESVGKLDAMLVELLAGGVAAGLARVEQEQAALRARVLFEQFFTRELSLQLAARPDMLEGRDAEVSVLFCDIRGFSRISDRIGPARTVEWIGSSLEELSDCVLDHDGVVVDYIGDELMAMWGAPGVQPDHAARACRAGLAVLGRLPALSERWQPVLGEQMRLGVGINTGAARVGNTGSQRKFKYGPLGHTVNLASRVQGATKYLKTRFLVTEATRQCLGAEFPARRICRVRVVNIATPVTLYELATPGQPDWAPLQDGYEKALEHFERGELQRAVAVLGKLLDAFPEDGPALVLMARAVSALVEEREDFDPVWELPGK